MITEIILILTTLFVVYLIYNIYLIFYYSHYKLSDDNVTILFCNDLNDCDWYQDWQEKIFKSQKEYKKVLNYLRKEKEEHDSEVERRQGLKEQNKKWREDEL